MWSVMGCMPKALAPDNRNSSVSQCCLSMLLVLLTAAWSAVAEVSRQTKHFSMTVHVVYAASTLASHAATMQSRVMMSIGLRKCFARQVDASDSIANMPLPNFALSSSCDLSEVPLISQQTGPVCVLAGCCGHGYLWSSYCVLPCHHRLPGHT